MVDFYDNFNGSAYNIGHEARYTEFYTKSGEFYAWIVREEFDRVSGKREYISAKPLVKVLIEHFDFEEDAARFVDKWCPELCASVCSYLYFYPYSWESIAQVNEKELKDILKWNDCSTAEEFEDKGFGSIFCDAAFDGYIVVVWG